MSRARINRGFFNFQQCLNAPNLSVIRCRKSYAGRNRPPARTESLGRIGGCRETGYAAGLVPKAHRQQVRRIEVSDRKSTRLNSSHVKISYAVFCLKKKNSQSSSAGEISLTSC